MTTETGSGSDVGVRSRRALLAGAGAAVAAALAGVLTRAAPAAAEGEAIVVGGAYDTARTPTVLRNRANDQDVLVARSDGSGRAIRARGRRTAVDATSELGDALQARTDGPYAAPGDADVEGGVGVNAYATFGHAIVGATQSGTGAYLYAETGRALHVDGRVRFDGASGVAVIPAGETSVAVVPFAFASLPHDSHVLLTPRVDLRGRSLWYTLGPASDRFRIHLGSPRSSATPIAWLVIG